MNKEIAIAEDSIPDKPQLKMKYTFTLPIYIFLGNKKISLNMNWYRNAHYMTLNKTKQSYYPLLFEKFVAERIHISYHLVWNNNRRTDLMNWITIADKYFLDWLVTIGYIPDDCLKNYPSIKITSEVNTKIDKSYVRAEVTILKFREDP